MCEKVRDFKYWISAYYVKYREMSFIITAIYRSPSSQEPEFYEVFEDILEELSEKNTDIIIAGDFNVDWAKESIYRSKLEQIINDNGLKQLVKNYTRITRDTKTIIDYVITNNVNINVNISNSNKISDHEIIDINVENTNQNTEQENGKTIDFFKYDKNKFQRIISQTLKFDEGLELNTNVYNFDEAIENTIKRLTIRKKIYEKSIKNKWFNRQLQTLKTEKIIKYNIAKYENTYAAWYNYRIARNKYKVKLENEKNAYINKKITNTKDQRQMWNNIKNLVLKKPKSVIQNVIFNNIEYKNNHDIANQFNEYFVKSIEEIRNNIENVQYINHINMRNTKFEFRSITITELKNTCKSIKKKPDFNNVNINLILENWNLIGDKLLNIINKSLDTGVFPENWKTSMVTPIEKIANTNKCEEFRPINTLKICEKIIEKIVKQQLEEYLEKNTILSKYQSGFRKTFSCETAVNYVINRWKKLEKNKKIMAIFLDFKRAFETIDRELLLQKLFFYGIQNKELNWFKSYLTNRKQITKVNNFKSATVNNGYGVPQGSILGALLFIIYINDMPNIIKNCEIVLYADDTLIFSESESDEQCHRNLTQDIENVNNWLKMNKLKLNENKTKIMEINMDNSSVFKINNTVIEKVEKIKYLGFIIDKKINLKEHIDYICKKIGKKIGFFKRIRNRVSILTAINIYNTIIKPHFEFGSTILYTCCTNLQIERLQKLQNRAMRSIIKCNRLTPIQFMLDTLKWLNIKQRLQLNTFTFIHKMKTGNAPEYLTEQLRYVNESQPYNLRNANDFRIHRAINNTTKRCLLYKGLQLFNQLPYYIKNESNINIFKRNCVFFIKNTTHQSF